MANPNCVMVDGGGIHNLNLTVGLKPFGLISLSDDKPFMFDDSTVRQAQSNNAWTIPSNAPTPYDMSRAAAVDTLTEHQGRNMTICGGLVQVAGSNKKQATNLCYTHSITGGYYQLPSMITARYDHTLINFRGRTYAMGGQTITTSGKEVDVTTIEVYDPNTGWHNMPNGLLYPEGKKTMIDVVGF